MTPDCKAALIVAMDPCRVTLCPLIETLRPGTGTALAGAKEPLPAVTVKVRSGAALGSDITRPNNLVGLVDALPKDWACAFENTNDGPPRLVSVLPKASNIPPALTVVPHWLSPLAATLVPETSVVIPVKRS